MAEEHKTFQLRYVGARFDGGRLPLDVLSDLHAFRDLLVSYAKENWRAFNSARRRLPKGFDKSISFDLIAIDEGSAMPKLDWSREMLQATLPGFADELGELVDRSYGQLIAMVDGAANDDFPRALSSEQIRALNNFGSALRDDERIEFVGKTGQDGNIVYLNTARRRALITRVRETYEVRFESSGRLVGQHEDGRIAVMTEDYGELSIPVEPERVTVEFDGNIGAVVQFSLQIELDSANALRRVVEVFGVDLIDDALADDLARCRDRVEALGHLAAGWHDGEGRLIDPRALDAANSLLSRRPHLATAYHIYPTTSGGVLFEFDSDGWDLSVEFTPEGALELFGVREDGPGEISPESFESLDQRFLVAFDAQTSRRDA